MSGERGNRESGLGLIWFDLAGLPLGYGSHSDDGGSGTGKGGVLIKSGWIGLNWFDLV
jgi:hypothetical protein